MRTVLQGRAAPVTVAECKAWSRISHSADDAVIATMIGAAQDTLEEHLRRAITVTTFRETFATFAPPRGLDWYFQAHLPPERHRVDWLQLTRAPVRAVFEVRYAASSTEQVVWPPAEWLPNLSLGRISPRRESDWPLFDGTAADSFTVEYEAGWLAGEVPNRVKVAVMQLVGHWYESREAYGVIGLTEIPEGVQAMVREYRVSGWA